MATQIDERGESSTGALRPQVEGVEPFVLHFGPVLHRLSDDEFIEFCQLNEDWRFELSGEGDLIIMSPTGAKSGRRNAKFIYRFSAWAEQDGTGQVFDSSTMFTLPNGAKRSPDLAWIRNERWNALSDEEQEKFSPLGPDFVAEIRSRTDSLKFLQRKMEEYIANGAQLGWLFDPRHRRVYVSRPNAPVEVFDDPETLSGEPLLRGFVLNVREIWD